MLRMQQPGIANCCRRPRVNFYIPLNANLILIDLQIETVEIVSDRAMRGDQETGPNMACWWGTSIYTQQGWEVCVSVGLHVIITYKRNIPDVSEGRINYPATKRKLILPLRSCCLRVDCRKKIIPWNFVNNRLISVEIDNKYVMQLFRGWVDI